MKILIVGAGGTLGQAVAAELGQRHEIIRAGRTSGDIQVDLRDPASVAAMYQEVGSLDAVVCTAGRCRSRRLANSPKQSTSKA
jgi:dTDP-4-dehydrorhamnose reductase